MKPKKRTEFPQKVSDKTLGAYVREHPHRTLREISQAVSLAISNVHRHLKNGGDAFLDEAAVDNRLFRVHARAPRGQQNYGRYTWEKRERVSMIGGYMQKRFIAPFTFKEGGGVTQMFLMPGLTSPDSQRYYSCYG